LIEKSKEIIDETTPDAKKEVEQLIEETIKEAFNRLKSDDTKKEFNALFASKPKKKNITGSGIKKRIKIIGRGFINQEVTAEKYLRLGKYKTNKEKLSGGRLRIRSENENQVNNVKSQMISKNIRDILLKINKKEIINYSDVDKLTENEKKRVI
jgi:isochorismate synthase EntC